METMEYAKKLANDADSEYVTPNRLIGEERYYPNSINSLYEFETPQHICLLKTLDLFKVIYNESPPKRSKVNYANAVLVATDDFVHIVFEDNQVNSMTVSYESISAVNIRKKSPRRRIEIKFGHKSAYWKLIEAKTSPDDMLDQAIQFIQTKVQQKSIFVRNLE